MNKHFHRLVFDRSRGFCVAVAETVAAAGKSASGERRSRGGRVCAAAALAVAAFAAQGQGLATGSALTGVAPRPTLPPTAATLKPTPGTAAALLPTGATVVKGAATVGVVGGDMTVNQSTGRLVTDWQSFSIGTGNSVRFVQPSTSAVALNRVTGSDPSAIFGSLVANGHVYLQNANGVYFAPGSQVSVGSLVATTLGIDVGEFMLGKLRLSGGNATSGSVDNAGNIVAAPGGYVVLAGPVVSNSGSIATPGGTAALVAGNAVDVDPLGSGLLSIRVPVVAVKARLAQSGSISADGGAVLLAAAASDAALRTVMQVGGVVRARSIESRDGQILLSGGPSGAVMVDGQLDASAGAGGQGGTIKVLGDLVGVTGHAKLDATGGARGGTILVGGNWQGKGPEANASSTYVGSGVVLDASATGQGDGGTVVVWADGHTNYFGQVNARGGVNGGDGGKVEVSGKATLNFQGGADLTAAHGKTGSLLLDPQFLTVGTVADLDGNGTPGTTWSTTSRWGSRCQQSDHGDARRDALNTADVTLQSQFTINFTAPRRCPPPARRRPWRCRAPTSRSARRWR
jgi:filamentous hemagglutinin family protein